MPALKKRPEEVMAAAMKRAFKIGLIEKDWTQRHLAKVTGLTRNTITEVFNDPIHRNFETILIVADKLGVNILADEFYPQK